MSDELCGAIDEVMGAVCTDRVDHPWKTHTDASVLGIELSFLTAEDFVGRREIPFHADDHIHELSGVRV